MHRLDSFVYNIPVRVVAYLPSGKDLFFIELFTFFFRFCMAVFDLEFHCDVTNYNIFLFRVIQPTQPNPTQLSQAYGKFGPVTVWFGLVGWKCLFIGKM